MASSDTKTADRIRREIDAGKGEDKIGFPDPAAAPIGTDAEAAGAPPTEEERRLTEIETARDDAKEEPVPIAGRPVSLEPGPHPDPMATTTAGWKRPVALGVGIIVLGILLAAFF